MKVLVVRIGKDKWLRCITRTGDPMLAADLRNAYFYAPSQKSALRNLIHTIPGAVLCEMELPEPKPLHPGQDSINHMNLSGGSTVEVTDRQISILEDAMEHSHVFLPDLYLERIGSSHPGMFRSTEDLLEECNVLLQRKLLYTGEKVIKSKTPLVLTPLGARTLSQVHPV